ncbi:MAG: M28 family peptidase, partial [Promethearchaeota archaeon]
MIDIKEFGQPIEFWEYFEKISKIPRCSRFEERVRDFIKGEGEKFGFQTQVDNAGNLAIFVPAKNTRKQKAILQCHMDMVCEKNKNVEHDFSKDPLKLKIVTDGNEKWLIAEGTTLGADNGTGICTLLTIMKRMHENALSFNSLELVLIFTVSEEVQLAGAKNIDKDLIDGDYLINLDGGYDGMITIGCNGGIGFIAKIKTEPITVDNLKEDLKAVIISIKGLIGGHSGGDINKGRGNAIKVLIQILSNLN